MTRNEWDDIGKWAQVGLAIVALHGATTKTWTQAHTALSVVAVLAIVFG